MIATIIISDVIRAYKSLLTEKQALEASLQAINSCESSQDQEASRSDQNQLKEVKQKAYKRKYNGGKKLITFRAAKRRMKVELAAVIWKKAVLLRETKHSRNKAAYPE